MMKNSNQRFADVIIALKVADEYGENIGRIQLQKFIYLADTISVLWAVLSPKNGHETYRHGPFDEAINNAVDSLSFRGFVDIIAISLDENERRVDALYRINQVGISLFNKLDSETRFLNKIGLYHEIGKYVQKNGWKKLKEMVYAEPTYIHSKASGFGFKFEYDSLLTNDSLRILFDFEKMLDKGQKISKENMIHLFFKLVA